MEDFRPNLMGRRNPRTVCLTHEGIVWYFIVFCGKRGPSWSRKPSTLEYDAFHRAVHRDNGPKFRLELEVPKIKLLILDFLNTVNAEEKVFACGVAKQGKCIC